MNIDELSTQGLARAQYLYNGFAQNTLLTLAK